MFYDKTERIYQSWILIKRATKRFTLGRSNLHEEGRSKEKRGLGRQ